MFRCAAVLLPMLTHTSIRPSSRPIETPCDLLGLYQWETLHLDAGWLCVCVCARMQVHVGVDQCTSINVCMWDCEGRCVGLCACASIHTGVRDVMNVCTSVTSPVFLCHGSDWERLGGWWDRDITTTTCSLLHTHTHTLLPPIRNAIFQPESDFPVWIRGANISLPW